jgi:hypothetical protein
MSVSDDPLIQLLLNHDRVDDWGAMSEDELEEYIDLSDAIRELISSEVEEFRLSLPAVTMSHYGTVRNRDSMSWALAQVRDRIARGQT